MTDTPKSNQDDNQIDHKPIPIMRTNDQYDLLEVDWTCVSDYLDDAYLSCLHWLSTSSHESAWFMHARIASRPWVMMLHNLDDDVLTMVSDMVHDGT